MVSTAALDGMLKARSTSQSQAMAATDLSLQRPFAGPASFTEHHAEYFFGRDAAVRSIVRMIDREPLLVVCGASGVGKTSALGAGVFPVLREQGRFPVLLRLPFESSYPLAAELMSAVLASAERHAVEVLLSPVYDRMGREASSQVAAAVRSTLWGFSQYVTFFSRDTNRIMEPVLVLDQFEEIFTRGFTRARECLHLVEDLADALTQELPEALQSAVADGSLELRERTAPKLRCVISIREDYVAQFDELVPSLSGLGGSRFRLTRLRRDEALAAVRGPAPTLVPEEVAPKILGILAEKSKGRGESSSALGEAGIEPDLLSLVLYELNETRIAREMSTITDALLSEARAVVLRGFYVRCLAGISRPTVGFIQDRLVTSSGFRTAVGASEASSAGASPQELDALVERRLLRIEDRFNEPQYELIHDAFVHEVRAVKEEARRLRGIALKGAIAFLAVVAATVGATLWYATESATSARAKGQLAALRIELDKARGKHLGPDEFGLGLRCLEFEQERTSRAKEYARQPELEKTRARCQEVTEGVATALEAEAADLPAESAIVRRIEAAVMRGDRYDGPVPDERIRSTRRWMSGSVDVSVGADDNVYVLSRDGVKVLRSSDGSVIEFLPSPIEVSNDAASGFVPSRLVVSAKQEEPLVIAVYGQALKQSKLVAWRGKRRVPEVLPLPDNGVTDLVLLDAARLLVASNNELLVVSVDGKLSVVESLLPGRASFGSLDRSPDGRVVAAGKVKMGGNWLAAYAVIQRAPDGTLSEDIVDVSQSEWLAGGGSAQASLTAVTWCGSDYIEVGTFGGLVLGFEIGDSRGARILAVGKAVAAVECCAATPGSKPSQTMWYGDGFRALSVDVEAQENFRLVPGELGALVRAAAVDASCGSVVAAFSDETIRTIGSPEPWDRSSTRELLESVRRRLGLVKLDGGASSVYRELQREGR
jgi:hypothetical protein